MNGYLAALAEYDLKLDGRKVRLVECISTEKGGEAGFQKVWKSRNQPTAIVAMSDIIAIGAMKAAQPGRLMHPGRTLICWF